MKAVALLLAALPSFGLSEEPLPAKFSCRDGEVSEIVVLASRAGTITITIPPGICEPPAPPPLRVIRLT